MSPRRIAPRLVLWVVVGVLLLGGGVLAWHRMQARGCGAGVQRIAHPADPLLTPTLMAQRPSKERDALVRAVAAMGAPFGEVLAGLDYHYDQYLHLYGVPGGLLAWTRRNAPVTFLDDQASPRWALRPATKRIAWDASADTFLLFGLATTRRTEVVAADLADGRARWCARLSTRNTDGDVLSTGFLPDGSVLVASASGDRISLVRLSGTDGDVRWRAWSRDVDRADAIVPLDEHTVVVGGREEFRLADPSSAPPAGAALTAFDPAEGKVRWRYRADGPVHVVGVSGGLLVVLERDRAGLRLLALDAAGSTAWSRKLSGPAAQATLRGGVVLTKVGHTFAGHDARDGHRLWRWQEPTDRVLVPYGFTLSQMPSLDAGHLLLPTTTALRLLDVHTGRWSTYPLPTDDINTTYWPYQLVATDALLGVVTNTGAVVVRRAPL